MTFTSIAHATTIIFKVGMVSYKGFPLSEFCNIIIDTEKSTVRIVETVLGHEEIASFKYVKVEHTTLNNIDGFIFSTDNREHDNLSEIRGEFLVIAKSYIEANKSRFTCLYGEPLEDDPSSHWESTFIPEPREEVSYTSSYKQLDLAFGNSYSSTNENNELPLILDGHSTSFTSYIDGGQTPSLGRTGALGDAITVRTQSGKMVDETSLGDYTVSADVSWLSFPYKTTAAFSPVAEINTTGRSRTATVTVTAGGVSSKFYVTQRAVTASIDKVWVDHNKWSGLTKGMKIHVKFNTYGVKGKTGRCSAYFYFENGQRLLDYNRNYGTYDGQVSTWADFSPGYDNTTFSDLELFIPYSELHINGHAECKFNLIISIGGEDTSSDYQHFTFN